MAAEAFLLYKQMICAVHDAAEDKSRNGGERHCKQGLLYRTRFLFYGKAGGGAGEVAEHKYDNAQRCRPRPAVCRKYLCHCAAARLGEGALTRVYHHHYWQNYLICGKTQDKRKDYHPVHTEKPAERVKEIGTSRKQCHISHGYVRKEP